MIPKLGPMQEQNEIPPVEPKEALKNSLAAEILDTNSDFSERIPGELKWIMSFNKEKGKPWNKEDAKESLIARTRGILAEVVSEKLQIDDARSVYVKLKSSSLPKVVPVQALNAAKTKEYVLKHAVETSLKEAPLKNPQLFARKGASEEEVREAKATAELEIIEGYGSKGRDEASSGIFYGETTIPDALLMEGTQLVGLSETKSYKPREFRLLVETLKGDGIKAAKAQITVPGHPGPMNLGVDLEKEIRFIDDVRAAQFGAEPLYEDAMILIRLPDDVPDDVLIEYGEHISNLGYKNVMIQKLPFTAGELEELGTMAIRQQMERIKEGGVKMNFSKREIALLEELTAETTD